MSQQTQTNASAQQVTETRVREREVDSTQGSTRPTNDANAAVVQCVPADWKKPDLQTLDWKTVTSYTETAHTFYQEKVQVNGKETRVAAGRCIRCGRYEADDVNLPRLCEGNKSYAERDGKLVKLRYVAV